ncbi:sulfatase-like hydrolase/transferase [Paenibacillus sp. IB182496]|uniref:Sulfatase-like hydrolase/transferase n=1 Tax=Paenibacillus sabuli TaxID=2772509 RepID=A0A927BQV6_9BACL|nr:alkaline phosphatase family protein [Paenibacillus sabuli]MBD2845082.1 sulfatase-like hydrolase/transferase [Paenibacillus sabuli]
MTRRFPRLAVLLGTVLPLLVLPLVTLGMTEVVHRASFSGFFIWLYQHPGEWLAGYLLLLGLLLALTLLLRRVYWAFAVLNLLAVTVASISRIKLKYRGEPLLPWDLKLGGEAADVASFFSWQGLLLTLLPVAIAAALGYVLARRMPALTLDRWTRLALSAAGVVLLMTLFGGSMKAKAVFDLEMITWDQGMNYNQNGMMIGLLLNAQRMEVVEPDGYDEQAVAAVTDLLTGALAPVKAGAGSPVGGGEPGEGASGDKPNLIMIMSEAFWDPTRMDAVSFSRDPLPHFRELAAQGISGTMLAPVYGGGTVNTEFEVLTGYSTQFLPSGSIAYANYVRTPQQSLASALRVQGYEATAVHSYHNWFYRRNEVYKLLGFDRFVSGEFFNEPVKRSGYISDDELTARIIREVRRSEGPDFVYAVSMQNHGPYYPGKNEEDTIRVQGLGESSTGILETYAQSLSEADAALGRLVRHFEESGEPTVIVFFGDHLPMLGADYQVYREAGYYQDGTSADAYMRMYGVPFLIWDNMDSAEAAEARDDGQIVGAPQLGQLALRQAGRQGGTMQELLDAMYADGQTYVPRADLREALGIDESWMERYRLLQYDRLFGSGYSYGGVAPTANADYQMGAGPIRITRVEVGAAAAMQSDESEDAAANEAGEALRIIGTNLPASGRVYVDGEPVRSAFVSEHELQIAWPRAEGEGAKIQVRLLDSLDRVVAESNVGQLP